MATPPARAEERVLLIIAVPRAQPVADAMGDFEEFRRITNVERPFLR